jgi:ribonucleotide reductase alpha subunit
MRTFTYQHVRDASIEYFRGDELAGEVFAGKYALQDLKGNIYEATPDDMHRREAREFARIETRYPNAMSEQEIYELFSSWDVVPQGSPMSAVGNPYQFQSLSNCFVIESPYDSYGGILKTDQEQAQIMKRRGGVGFDISTIRPKGIETANAARTTDGLGIFMERYSNTCREVAQGGRRGALMLTVSVHHPEIRTFINIKKNKKKVTGANISIRLTDEFMNAVKAGTQVQLRFPVDKDVPHIVEEQVDARQLWHEIIQAAWESAEPGLLFWDTVLRRGPADAYAAFGYGSTSTNPCITGETLIAVADGRGYVPIKQLADEGKDLPVYCYQEATGKIGIRLMRNPRLTGKGVPVFKVTIEGGHTFKATGNHTMIMRDGSRKRVDELLNGDQLWVAHKVAGKFAEYSAKMSESVGGANNPRAYDNVTNDDIRQHVLGLTRSLGRRVSLNEWYAYAKQRSLPMSFSAWRRSELGSFYDLSCWAAREVDISTPELDTRIQRTYVQALEEGYDVDVIDGELYVNRTCEWCNEMFALPYCRREQAFCSHSCSNLYANRKANKNVARAENLKKLHADRAEVTRKQQLDAFTSLRFTLGREPLGREWVAECRRLDVPARIGTKNGFASWSALKEAAALHNHRVISVEPAGVEDVYNGTVDGEHTLCMYVGDEKLVQFQNQANVIIASEQCGEITLSPYDSCRLLLVNLARFVRDPFTPHASFDFVRFNDVVKKAQKLMDDLVDLELEAIDRIMQKIENDPEPADVKRPEIELWTKIRNTAINGRRTGLGITALGDALAYLNIKYGSDESINVTEQIYKGLALGAYRSTVEMARDRGPFPIFSHKVEEGHPFIEQVMDADHELRDQYRLYGRRNIALTTTAPAGSVSILTQTTSGCEPAFLLSYKRRKKINPNDLDARVDFVDAMGDKWQEYTVYHHGFKKWMDVTGETDVEKSPYFGATSNDIDWVKKIDVQAAAQKWVCHSISNTTNIPSDTPVDVVKQIYMRGWETGCKGVTIYRDGSRDGVLIKDEKKTAADQPKNIAESHSLKRPKELECDIHHVSIKGEKYLVFVGLMNGKPYELFAGLSEQVEVPRKAKKGVLIKNGKNADGVSTYNLRVDLDDNFLLYKDIVNLFDNPLYGAHTRTLSMTLRHGVPVHLVVEQLRKDKHSDLFSFSTVIARTLSKHYIVDGTKATQEKCCPICASTSLAYQQGCVTCMNCGNSKCG